MRELPVFLFACQGIDRTDWLSALGERLEGVELRVWPDTGPLDRVRFAIGWNNPPGFWAAFPRLEAIFSLGAGVEAILADPDLPRTIPIIRMIDPSLEDEMADFVIARVIHHHRYIHRYERQQAQRLWAPIRPPLPHDRIVGIMELGRLGARCARDLAARHFSVRGWSRMPRAIAGVDCFHGPAGLEHFAAGCEILVCLLPLTPETRAIIDASLLDRLAPGACLINVGRGAHLVDEDLLRALDNGHIDAATLDVFHAEPLAEDHAFWRHPAIRILPHVAAFTHPQTAALAIRDNLDRLLKGQPVEGLVITERGY